MVIEHRNSMIKILEIITEDREISHFLRHIQWNLLEKLKKDKEVRKTSKLIIDIAFENLDEKFIARNIRGNQETICNMDVVVDRSIEKSDLGVLVCQVIQHLYDFNGWDNTMLKQLENDVREQNYIFEQSIVKKSINADLKFEIALMIKQEYIEYFVVVTNKKTKVIKRFTFFKAILNPFSIKFLLNKIEVMDDVVVISDFRNEIKIKLNLFDLKAEIFFEPKEHDADFLKRFYESFKYDYKYGDQNELFVKYMNV